MRKPLNPISTDDQVQKDRERLSILEQAAQNPAYSQVKRAALASLAKAQQTVLGLRQGHARVN